MEQKMRLKGVKVHNLKGVDLTLDPQQLIVFTGVSGSGKSSLAFHTIYIEGQRRYIESLGASARRQLGDFPKPDAELIEGISPTIAIEQKTSGRSPRSTVGTMTGIYDFLRLLYARVGIPHCPVSKEAVSAQSVEQMLREVKQLSQGSKIILLSPLAKGKKGELKEELSELTHKGYTKVRLDGQIIDLSGDISIDGKVPHDLDLVIDRLIIRDTEWGRITEGLTEALEKGGGIALLIDLDTGRELLFSKHAYSPKSGLSYAPLQPQDFSFNHPAGMCESCLGIGTLHTFDLAKVIDQEKSISEDCCSVGSSYQTIRYGNIFDNLARFHNFKVTTPWKNLSDEAKKIFLYGDNKKWTRMEFVHREKKRVWTEYVRWEGVLTEATIRYREASSDSYRQKMEELMEHSICPACQGARIRSYPAATQFRGKEIYCLTQMPIATCLNFFKQITLTGEEEVIAADLVKEIKERLLFLFDVGLHYLTLERTSPTLSGGEAQRVRLAAQIGSGLSNATYVLDEPSIGLHPRDNHRLLTSLKTLCSMGNTVIVVEHDEETIAAADHIVDVGPMAGALGGEIISSGSLKNLLDSPHSITGDYLAGRRVIPVPKKRRTPSKLKISISGATHHNLKKVDVAIPLEVLVAITGVSGSGKSSLITDILYPALSNALHGSKLKVGANRAVKGVEAIDKVIAIDQSPIGRTPRSNPSTYVKLFDEIRDLFANLPEAKAHGYLAGRFSFNVKEGSCPHCSGMGMIKIDMDFMEDEWLPCTVCKGHRFDPKTLSILYKGKSIYDVLEMTITQASSFFEAIPTIKKKVDLLLEVGLGYLKLGQSSPTLSGGEAQRIKLAKELSRPSTGRTLYILDEPTTGLHFYDIHQLVTVLQRLVDKKNSVIVIEHNMDLIKTADWVIDLGPEGGEMGGEIVAAAPPEKIAAMQTPTGSALRMSLYPVSLQPKEIVPKQSDPKDSFITVEKGEQNHLKGVSLKIPHGKITICTGPSGSGKSSLAFDTVYAEGQRRYTDSMSPYARQFIKQMSRPKVESISGLLASIAIEQKNHAGNPRSTIGTLTDIYDYLRVLFAHLGTPYCPETKEEIRSISKEDVVNHLMALGTGAKVEILAPLDLKEGFEAIRDRLRREGFLRIRLNQVLYELDEQIPFEKGRKNELLLVVDRIVITNQTAGRLFEAVDNAAKIANGTLVAHSSGNDLFFNLAFAVPSTGKSYPPITPHTFSFNTEMGMCPSCMGLGFQYGANLQRHRAIMRMSPKTLIKKLWKERSCKEAMKLFEEAMETLQIEIDTPLDHLPKEQLSLFLSGSEKGISRLGASLRFRGIGPVFAQLAKSALAPLKEELTPWVDQIPCPSCEGTRLHPLARNVLIGGISIAALCRMPIEKALPFIEALSLDDPSHHFLKETKRQLTHRLHFLATTGLEYLSLDRSAPTLSGGEMQRIRLARQLGSGLTGCLYVLDEPTIGLHPHQNAQLNGALKHLCSLGNTLLLVEHDPLTLQIADQVVDFGPSAGKLGGEIVARGTLEQIKADPLSLTGSYLTGRKALPIPEKRRPIKETLSISGASLHNLKNLSLEIPIGAITCITGLSGSGKSTLVTDLLRPAIQLALAVRKRPPSIEYLGATFSGIDTFDKLLSIDQNPIGHTIRADVSTYVDLAPALRSFFAELPEAKIRGLKGAQFSSNHIKGMCTKCWGLGKRKIEMQFLPPIRVLCDSCHGFRLNPLSLQVHFKGKHMGHLLQMSVDEALQWLPPIPKVIRILETLVAVGLGYLELGQEIATLSGGEAQRLRLSRELAKRSNGKTLYLFDEPTIGLHSDDIGKLLPIFDTLANLGNTIVIVEHNLDLIAYADYLIDLGPEAGALGGQIICRGTPEEVASHPTSYTAHYLKEKLRRHELKKM